jgi:hypothetical protein
MIREHTYAEVAGQSFLEVGRLIAKNSTVSKVLSLLAIVDLNELDVGEQRVVEEPVVMS